MNTTQFYIDGIHHRVLVKFVSDIALRAMTKTKDEEDIWGFYNSSENCIYINWIQDVEKMKHTFWHEVGHYLDYELEEIEDEEIRADLLGSFLLRLTKGRFIDEFRARD